MINRAAFKQMPCFQRRSGYLWPRTLLERSFVKVMGEWADRISKARTRVGELLADQDQLKATATKLEAELRERERTLEVLKARVTELERENEVLRTVRPAARTADRAGTKERIDELVHEIDRCLELLKA